jgi:hypothetical protein
MRENKLGLSPVQRRRVPYVYMHMVSVQPLVHHTSTGANYEAVLANRSYLAQGSISIGVYGETDMESP